MAKQEQIYRWAKLYGRQISEEGLYAVSLSKALRSSREVLMSDSDKDMDKILEEYEKKSVILNDFYKHLFENEPEYRIKLKIIIMQLHHEIEDAFNSILSDYTGGSRTLGKSEYDSDIMKEMRTQRDPDDIRNDALFDLGFEQKKALIYKTFKVSDETTQTLNKLNEIRNAVAHRYPSEHKRYSYKDANIFDNSSALDQFLKDCLAAENEILEMVLKLKRAIEQSIEDELGLE